MTRRAILLLLSFSCWLTPCACSKKTEGPPSHPDVPSSFESFPRGAGRQETDRWYLVEFQGQPSGWAHTQVTRHSTPQGPRWVTNSEEFIVMRRGTERMEARTAERYLENERGQLLRFWEMEQEQSGEKVIIQAGKVGAEMVTVRGPETYRVPFEPQAFATQRCYRILFTANRPEAGEVKQYRSYDPRQANYEDVRIAVKSVGAKTIEVEQTNSSMPGVVTKVQMDETYIATRAETRIGVLHLLYRQVAKKPDIETDGLAPDLDPLMVIPSNVPIQNPRTLARARYRIEGLPEHVDSSWLNGPGQRVTGHPSPDAFLLETEQMGEPVSLPFPLDVKKPELKKYLASTSLTRLEDPQIRKTAKTVTAEAPDAWTAAKRLRQWVSEEIEGSMGMGFASASHTLQKQEGDCSEQSVLLTALARSVGIPARCIMGLVYQDGSFFRHMWTEVWVGRWQPLDPAQATDHISAAWIRLAVHSLQLTDDEKTGAGGLLLFGAKLKVIVEKVETTNR
ncbi:transglutaminase family protein [Myxococcota bacterium]